MKVKDKKLKKMVNVSGKECQKFECYWPRPNPGIFVPGQGYRSFGDGRDKEYICGTRNIHGCPDNEVLKDGK